MDAPQNSTPKKERPRWVKAFLAALAETGNVAAAARLAKIDRTRAYQYRKDDATFAEQWVVAIEEAADLLELEARRRAHDGVDEPVVYQGELMGAWVGPDGQVVSKDTPGARQIPLTIKKYSDTLLIFLLKGAKPDKYRERYEHSLKDLDALITAELARLTGVSQGATAGATP